jgi:hypothetical protein
MLSAGAGRPVGIDSKIVRIDLHLFYVGRLRQHRDRAGGRVDTALRFRFRHPLHAMSAGFELELGVRPFPHDAGDDLFEAAVLPLASAQDFDFPTLVLGVAAVHSK